MTEQIRAEFERSTVASDSNAIAEGISLLDFCAKDDPRIYLKKPFNIKDKTIATNGHILLIVDKIDGLENECATRKLTGPIGSILSMEFGGFVALPQIDFDIFACAKCSGIGLSNYCYECEGDGVVYFESDFNSYCCNCLSCNEKDSPYCVSCNGLGYGSAEDSIVLTINGTKKPFNAGYIRLVSKLKDVKVSLHDSHSHMKFTFKKGFGFLMPLDDSMIKKSVFEYIIETVDSEEF